MTEIVPSAANTTQDFRVSADNDGRDCELLPRDRGSRLDTFKKYCQSNLGVELLFSLSILVVDLLFRNLSPDPRQRRLPYQLLESTGDYVVNQSYSEEFVGETVSNVELYMYGAIIPFVIQM